MPEDKISDLTHGQPAYLAIAATLTGWSRHRRRHTLDVVDIPDQAVSLIDAGTLDNPVA